jgi:Flp pilus assembly protein TadG
MRRRAPVRDQRGFVSAYVLRFVLVFALVIVAVEEAGQVVWAQVRASNAAGAAAQAAADDFHVYHNADHAETAARDAMHAEFPTAAITGFTITTTGETTVTATLPASTFLLQHLPYLSRFRKQHATVVEVHSLA